MMAKRKEINHGVGTDQCIPAVRSQYQHPPIKMHFSKRIQKIDVWSWSNIYFEPCVFRNSKLTFRTEFRGGPNNLRSLLVMYKMFRKV